MRLVLVFFAVAFTSAARAEECILLPLAGGDPPFVELFLAKPDGQGPWPLIVFVHGHQSAPRPGARVFIRLDRRPALATVDEGRLEQMRQRGYVAAAVSLAGYGDTPDRATSGDPGPTRRCRRLSST